MRGPTSSIQIEASRVHVVQTKASWQTCPDKLKLTGIFRYGKLGKKASYDLREHHVSRSRVHVSKTHEEYAVDQRVGAACVPPCPCELKPRVVPLRPKCGREAWARTSLHPDENPHRRSSKRLCKTSCIQYNMLWRLAAVRAEGVDPPMRQGGALHAG